MADFIVIGLSGGTWGAFEAVSVIFLGDKKEIIEKIRFSTFYRATRI